MSPSTINNASSERTESYHRYEITTQTWIWVYYLPWQKNINFARTVYFKCHLNSIMMIRGIISSIHFILFHTCGVILYLNLWVVNVFIIGGSSFDIFSVPRLEIPAKICGRFTTDRTPLAWCEVLLVIHRVLIVLWVAANKKQTVSIVIWVQICIFPRWPQYALQKGNLE